MPKLDRQIPQSPNAPIHHSGGRLSLVSRRLLVAALSLAASLPTAVLAADRTTARDFVVEPATLVSLGFEWHIDGDDNRNATVAVFYRKKDNTQGAAAWREGPPLLRIGNERINEN